MNWQRGLATALMGVGDRYSSNYDRMRDEQAQIAKENRMYETSMRKEQEIAKMRQSMGREDQQWQMDQKRQQLLDAGITEDDPRFTEAMTGVGPSEERQIDLAKRKAQAEVDIKTQAAQKAQDAQLAKVDEIIAKAPKDENGNPKFGMSDQIRLATMGIKVPEQKKPVNLDGDNLTKIHSESRKEAAEKFHPDLVSDADAVNTANQYLEAAGKPPIPEGPGAGKIARKLLIDNETTAGYIRAVTLISGAVPTSTPDGGSVTEEQATSALEDGIDTSAADVTGDGGIMDGSESSMVMEGTAADVNQKNQQRIAAWQRRNDAKKAEAGQTPVAGLEDYKLPGTQPQVGTTTLPQQPEAALGAGDPRVDDIISRMNQR